MRLGLDASVLVAVPDANVLDAYAAALGRVRLRVLTAHDSLGALMKGIALRPDVVVMDLSLPGLDNLDVARRLKEHRPVPVILVGDVGDEKAALVARCLFLKRAATADDLATAVLASLRR